MYKRLFSGLIILLFIQFLESGVQLMIGSPNNGIPFLVGLAIDLPMPIY